MELTSDDMRQILRYKNRPERKEVMEAIGLAPTNPVDHATMYRVFRAIGDVVRARKKCVFPGLGTFEWKPKKGVLPNGEKYESKMLKFALTRADRRMKHG